MLVGEASQPNFQREPLGESSKQSKLLSGVVQKSTAPQSLLALCLSRTVSSQGDVTSLIVAVG